jgi:hypothetical protein
MGNALGVTAPTAPVEKCAVAVGDHNIRGEKQLKHMNVVKLVGIALGLDVRGLDQTFVRQIFKLEKVVCLCRFCIVSFFCRPG